MSNPYNRHSKDRLLEKALTSRIIDEYFEHSESWFRAILRMCIFSITRLDGLPALIIECPNQTIAKRLSRKTSPLQEVVHHLIERYPSSKRVLICYRENPHTPWRCFDTNTNTWQAWETPQTPTASTE